MQIERSHCSVQGLFMTFPAIHRVGGGESPHASVFVPVMMYPVYKLWGEMYHQVCCVKCVFCEADGFNIKDREKRSICTVFLIKVSIWSNCTCCLKKKNPRWMALNESSPWLVSTGETGLHVSFTDILGALLINSRWWPSRHDPLLQKCKELQTHWFTSNLWQQCTNALHKFITSISYKYGRILSHHPSN